MSFDVEVPVPKPTTDVVTEKTYITTEPEVEIASRQRWHRRSRSRRLPS
jgi:hypothetical protein